MERSSRQKINKETQALNNTLDQMNLIDIYRAFHPKAAEHIFFSSAHGTFSSIDHMLGHIQASVNLRKLKSYQAIFPSRAMRLEVNYKKKTVKNTNTWRQNNTNHRQKKTNKQNPDEVK